MNGDTLSVSTGPLFPAHPALDNLPSDTLSLILGQFCLHCTKERDYESPDGHGTESEDEEFQSWHALAPNYCKPLLSMCLVSKRILPVAQGILHHAFVLGCCKTYQESLALFYRRLRPFLRTIMERPDLAAAVRRICIHGPLVGRVVASNELPSIHELLSQELDRLRAGNPPLSRRAPDGRLVGGMTVRLLDCLTNLERLSLSLPNNVRYLTWRAETAPEGLFSQLKTLDMCRLPLTIRGTGGHTILEAAGTAENLQVLNLVRCFWDPDQLPTTRLENLRALLVVDPSAMPVSARSLQALLDLCSSSKLQSFHYVAPPPEWFFQHQGVGWNNPDGPNRDDHHFSAAEAIRSLATHETTLQMLHLDFRRREGLVRWEPAVVASQPIPRNLLRGFTSLTHLFLTARMVGYWQLREGWDRPGYSVPPSLETPPILPDALVRLLPPNIITFHLAGCSDVAGEQLMAVLLGLADTIGTGAQFTSLRYLRCDAEPEQLDQPALRGEFAAVGVDFVCKEFSWRQ
ncbi:hypothetical protein QBC43DRAFT_367356 [Cladorrhinum sp. PSN259]|nr:hypothetical protein QBC43DRAFT_367356 [Cladorrhinum sp. PSN259]